MLDSLHEYEDRTGDDDISQRRPNAAGATTATTSSTTAPCRATTTADRYPVDATAAAQSLLTLCRFGDVATARRVADWSLEHLQRRDGAFAFQLHRRYTNRIPYMRWSTAWMYCGLARVELAEGA